MPISAILFGAAAQQLVPLVYQAFNWQHGTFLGATLASETTAAATGAVGVVRRDPMAMLPFCGYNMGDYWAHWLRWPSARPTRQKFFASTGSNATMRGRFLWPGFGENLRVLRWVIERSKGRRCRPTRRPSVMCPRRQRSTATVLNVSKADLDQLVAVDREGWKNNLRSQGDFFDTFGDHLPAGIKEEHKALANRLKG